MSISKRTRTLGAAALFACSPLAVLAQTTTPATPERPQATEPARPSDPAMKPAEPTRPATAAHHRADGAQGQPVGRPCGFLL